MTRTTKSALCVGVVLLGVASSDRAAAGAHSTPNVTINTSTHTASGALGTARRVGVRQYISCDVSTAASTVHCEATTEAGAHIDCSLPTDPFDDTVRQAVTVGQINPDSYISFIWGTLPWVTGNACMAIRVVSSSEYEPKP